ncbi:MAG: surface carbohydrate biosynthesis protein [Gammaproteobacteria bacterium]|jgi:surface carbohydrate biosynthesis protein
MTADKPSLIIPVENQVRELDPKLLLACVAARRGYQVFLGYRGDIDARIAALPPAIYLSKSMTARSRKMFSILRQLGHDIMVWDEEALVHHPPEVYFTRRLSPASIAYVSRLLAWGKDNAALFHQYPQLPDIPVDITGNPRGDMLRPEIRPYFDEQVRACRTEYGDFILVNTNFGWVNAFVPVLNLFIPASGGPDAEIGRGAVGMPREYAEQLRMHRQQVMEAFLDMIPRLTKAFPDHTIVVRPHPVEDPSIYHEIAAAHPGIRVVNEGNVVIWLLASRAVIHNGCTTGIEAYLLDVPALAYLPVDHDIDINRLPNDLGYECRSFDELASYIRRILSGEIGPADGDARCAIMDGYLEARNGPLASERIISVLDAALAQGAGPSRPAFTQRARGWYRATKRRVKKAINSRTPGSRNSPAFHRHRYPGISLEELVRRVNRFQGLLQDSQPLSVCMVSDHIYSIAADAVRHDDSGLPQRRGAADAGI